MLKSLAEILKQLLGYANDTKKNKDDLEKLSTKFEIVINDVRQIASDADADRRVAAEQRKTPERDYDNLVLRLQLAIKDIEQRALPPGPTPHNATEMEARLTAFEAKVEELAKQIEELKRS